jgi:hypothetical protein
MNPALIRLATALIPVKSVRRRLRRRLLRAAQSARVAKTLPRVLGRYAAHERACREALARGTRLKVAFLVCDASMFSGESVFAKMSADPRFECFVAVAPRVTRGEDFLRSTLKKTMETLSARYGNAVRSLYDPDSRKSRPLDADIVFSTVVYEDQTLPEYTTERLSERSLVCILYYGYGGLFISNEKKTPYLPNIVLSWRYFVSNEATRLMNIEKNPLLADNATTVGYAKMDRLATIPRRQGGGKTVLICPHHTLDRIPGELALSTFLKNAGLFLRLPELFPEVTFVFRPHPLLFPRLATAKWWGPERTAAYERAMEAHPNVVFQRGGDYFEAFRNSDALIHDCGSFLAEYFYTGCPQCYLLESEATLEEQFLPFARTLAEHVRKAYTDEEVVSFIRDVAAGRDPDRESRAAFAAKEVCVNHPDATSAVLAVLDAALAG